MVPCSGTSLAWSPAVDHLQPEGPVNWVNLGRSPEVDNVELQKIDLHYNPRAHKLQSQLKIKTTLSIFSTECIPRHKTANQHVNFQCLWLQQAYWIKFESYKTWLSDVMLRQTLASFSVARSSWQTYGEIFCKPNVSDLAASEWIRLNLTELDSIWLSLPKPRTSWIQILHIVVIFRPSPQPVYR